MLWLQWAFWVTVFLLFFTYAGYPLLLWGLVRVLRPKKTVLREQPPLSVSIVLVARNEEGRIAARLTNLLEGSPATLQELIVVLDGCTDSTAQKVKQFADPRIRLVEQQPGKGKPAGLNTGIQAATGEVVMLCDARQRFESDTISRLVDWFQDPRTGAVSGTLEIERSLEGTGQGVDVYWRLEKGIRQLESTLDSSVGCSGAVYALRRSAFSPIPEDTILDDVVIPMQIAKKGFRVRFCPDARAFDPQALSGSNEKKRKVRTLAGNFQLLFRYPNWTVPWGHRLWWKLILHKYLRLLGPVLMLVLLVVSVLLRGQVFYLLALLAQLLIYALSLLVWKIPSIRNRLCTILAGFVFLQVCIVQGFLYWLTGRSARGWK